MELKNNLFRFFNYVRLQLPNQDPNIMFAASKTLGRIADLMGPAFADNLMDSEVQYAIKDLQSDKPQADKPETRHAGVLILKEIARRIGTAFYPHIPLVLDRLLVPLRDSRLIVREAAAELLGICLDIIARRDKTMLSPFVIKILQDAQAGVKAPQPEIIHGSLLTYRELLLHGAMVSENRIFPVSYDR